MSIIRRRSEIGNRTARSSKHGDHQEDFVRFLCCSMIM